MKYKISKFNTAIYFEGKVIYHNSLTNKFMLLEPILYDLIIASKNEDVSKLKDFHPTLFKELIRLGFIVDSNKDEIKKVKELIKTIDNTNKYYRLIINPTMNCNFKCWYCYENHINNSKVSKNTLKSIINLIKNIVSNDELETFDISFFGGEPLLHYNKTVKPIIQKAIEITPKKINLNITFTTNGLLITDEMINEFVKFKISNLQITLDGNKDLHDKVRYISKNKGSYSKIVDNIKKLVKNKISVTMRINYTTDNFNSIISIVDDFNDLAVGFKKRIIVSLHRVWQDEYTFLDTSSLIRKFKKEGFNITDSAVSDTVRYSCYADKRNQATINYNGDVFKCTARDFTSETKEGVLDENGNINWSERQEFRLNAKLKNKPCLECSILPICGGGCSQHALEALQANKEYCVHNFDEERKKNLVKNIFLNSNLLKKTNV